MNSSLPSLLDAIFGKKDLALVSIEEMNEVISEFPSFNAAHFLLSKKLRLDNDTTFEKICMRTALYFNNPLWLESLLEEENRSAFILEKDSMVIEEKNGYPSNETEPELSHEDPPGPQFPSESRGISDHDIPVAETPMDTIPDKTAVPAEEFQAMPESIPAPEENSGHPERFSGTVSSFDELVLKYQIESPAPAIDSSDDQADENAGIARDTIWTEPGTTKFESRDEILNEYGIFEEEIIRETDRDHEAFDRPVENRPSLPDEVTVESPEQAIPTAEIENITENLTGNKSPEKSDEGDYEAFDRTVEDKVPEEQPAEMVDTSMITAESLELDAEFLESEADDTNASEFYDSGEPEIDEEMQDLVSRFGEKQKSMPLFDAKKAESIVFAPYHMIDYFASQGIKLVLEDHPADSFGKQLKSFTDWLRVMKKLPHQQGPEKPNEKEAENIRHFAAHSIEERDILTEAMAEVLAKQGMYENAIALFQKLSLIYPPKSAYFASRIEQLKASLP